MLANLFVKRLNNLVEFISDHYGNSGKVFKKIIKLLVRLSSVSHNAFTFNCAAFIVCGFGGWYFYGLESGLTKT